MKHSIRCKKCGTFMSKEGCKKCPTFKIHWDNFAQGMLIGAAIILFAWAFTL